MAFTHEQITELVENAAFAATEIRELLPEYTPETQAKFVMVILRADAETIREQKAKPIPKAMR